MSENKPSIKKNFLYSTTYQLFNVIIPFITAPYVSRILGADGIGIQSYTASVQSYFLLFAALGTMTYGAREISMNRDDPYKRSKLFWEIELMTVMTSFAALIAWVVLILNSSESYRIYYEVLTIGIFATLFDITWFFNGIEQFKLTVVRNVFFKLIGIVCLFTLIKDKDDLLLYIFILSMTTLLSSVSLWPYMKKYLVRVKIGDLRFKHHFRETLIYFIPTIATSVYTVLDRTLIGLITHSNSENGYYQQAEKVIGIAKSLVFTAINSVVGVRIAYLYAEKQFDEIRRRIEESFNYIFFMGFGCCFGIIGIAKTFVPVFFGPGYDKVIQLLYIFSPIVVVIGISNCLGTQYYTPCGKRSQSAKFIISGSALNLLLNLVCIPRLGAFGAAIASLAAELLITFLYVSFSGSFCKLSMLIQTGYKKCIAGIIMLIPIFLMNRLLVNPLILVTVQVIVGIAIYILALIALKDSWTVKFLLKIKKRFITDIR